jgi:DNA-nicking Smr family endonuclease
VRRLSPEEAALWARVTATIQPLSREKIKPEAVENELQYSDLKPLARQPRLRSVPAAAPARPRLGNTLDASWDRRLRSGAAEPDRVLDLHGMTLDSAWRAIDRVLEQATNAGDRIVLLITGHHRPGGPPVERGRIRAAVHGWLAASRHAPSIAAVRGAHRRHGGGGSLYIVLRRR